MNPTRSVRPLLTLALAVFAFTPACSGALPEVSSDEAALVNAPSTTALDEGIAKAIHADVAQSVKLPNGKSLWVFGDTTSVNGKNTVGHFGYPHNAFAVQSPGSSHFTPLAGPYGYGWQQVPNWDDGTYFWPMVPVVDGGVLYVLGVRVRGVVPFTVLGNYAAAFDAQGLAFQGTVALPGGTTVWGGVSKAATGWWLSGTHPVSCSDATDCKVGDVAFVPFGQIDGPREWQLHKDVFPATTNVGTAIALRETSTGWDAFTKQGDAYGGSNIIRLQAKHILGPWTVAGHWDAAVVTSKDITYAVAVHPEQPAPGGHVLVSYAENGKTYAPRFLYLPL